MDKQEQELEDFFLIGMKKNINMICFYMIGIKGFIILGNLLVVIGVMKDWRLKKIKIFLYPLKRQKIYI